MADYEQDIIRKVQIGVQVDTDTIKKSSSTLDNFYKKYQRKDMKVDTSDFNLAIDAVRALKKELDTTQKNAPRMDGIISQMSGGLEEAGRKFKDAIVHFTNGDIAHGLHEAVDKITQGLSVKTVDLGEYFNSLQSSIQGAVDMLKDLNVFRDSGWGKSLNFNNLDAKSLESTLGTIQKIKEAQQELESFKGQTVTGKEDWSSGFSTKTLENHIKFGQQSLDELKSLNIKTMAELERRREIIANSDQYNAGYSDDDISEYTKRAHSDRDTYEMVISELEDFIERKKILLQELNSNSYLFTSDEISQYEGYITSSMQRVQQQIVDMKNIPTDNSVVKEINSGNFSEVVNSLNEIKTSLQTISDVFQRTEISMRDMTENSATSFTKLSETITEVYNNLTQIQTLVDAISKKDFNITHITQTGSGADSNLQAMTKQMAVARETMEHLRQLYDQAGDTLQILGSKGQFDVVIEYSKQLQELNLTDISKSVKGANTEMKLASVLAEMQDYINKLIQINELRNKFNLGEWKDTFVPTQQSIVKQTSQPKSQVIETPAITQPQSTVATSNVEAQHMWQLKAAIDEVSNAIGRKNAGFVKEAEIVGDSVKIEKEKLQELVDFIMINIVQALENLKKKFGESLTMPELNQSNIQNSLDEVFKKFVELQEKISKIQFNVAPKADTTNISIANSADNTKESVSAENQSAIDAAKSFVDAANAKKQFVEANKQVADSAKTSEDVIKKEADAAKTVATDVGNVAKDLAKTKDIFNNAGELIQTDTTRKFTTDKAVVTETESTRIARDDDGNESTSTITTIVNDFEKLTKETKKSEEAVARAQKKLDEFLARFQSKSGGNAKFISGFSELEKTTVTADNMESVFNQMMELQKEYSQLETNFRKGQSSLNPFVNAITKSENIGNIFGDVERQFNGLTTKSDELVNNFAKLQNLAQKIQAFIQLMNSNPSTITPDMFSEFSKQVGEFNVLKSQVEGSIKSESRIEAQDAKKQAEAYAEILRLVKERNKFLAIAENSDQGSIKQRNALMDAYKVEQQLHILGKQIVLTDEQRAELARVREEQARKIRDIEADNKVKADNQKTSTREQQRKKEVEDYIKLVQQKNEYEARAAKGGAMQPTYQAKVAKLQQEIADNDKQSIMNQEEKNRLLAIEEAHQLKIAEIQQRKQTGDQIFSGKNDKLQGKFNAGYLSEDKFNYWKSELATYQSYLDGTVSADEATIKKKEANLTQLYDHLNKISNASRTFFASGGEMLSTWFSPDQIQNVSSSLHGLYDNIVSERFDGMKTTVTSVNETLGRLTFTVDNGRGALTTYTIAMDKASGATKLLSGNTKDTLSTVQQFSKALKQDTRGIFSAFIGGMSGMYAVGRYIRQGIQDVRELDKALTELKKVTDETEETYDRFLQTAGQTSARIGSTLSNFTNATAEFAKLGYGVQQAATMAESALVYTNVGDNIDVETGSQSIISTMKAFGVEANNTMSIVDKFNEIGNNFAITTKGIGDALQVSASAMAAAGNTLDETVALTTAANTIVQNPNTVGTALKTLSLRIRGVKTELEEAGLETDGMAETTSQLQAKLKALTDGKVDIMVDANNFKNTTEILREMSKEWENLTDVEQAAALELLGGKRQANTLSAIISNFDIVEDAIEASLNAEGSAMEENEKVLQSIEGRITLFSNSVERFWNNLLDNEVIKMFVDLGTTIVELASKFGELKSVIFAILMYFNMSKKYPFDLASIIFGPDGINQILKGLGRIKSFLHSFNKTKPLALPAPGLPAPQERLGLPAAQTGLVPTGPTSLTPTNAGSLMPISQMSEEEKTNFFANMIKNAQMAAQNIWKLFMNMINKLKTAASNIFTGAFNTIKTKLGSFTNQIKKTYYKATKQPYATDITGKAYKGKIVDRRVSVYDDSNNADAKTASRVSQMWQNHMARLRDSIGRVKQDISTVWQHHNERVAQSVQYASTQFNKLKKSVTNTFSKISAVTSNVANGIRSAYGRATDSVKAQTLSIRNAFVKATSKAYMTDETGKVHRAKVLPSQMPTVYEQPEQSYNKVNEAINKIKINLRNTIDSGKWMFEDLAARVGYQFDKIRTNIGSAVSGTFNNIRSNVESGFNKTINSVSTAFNKIKSKFGKQSSTRLVPFDDRGAKQSYSGFTATAKKVSAEVNRIWAKHIENLNGSFKSVQNEFTRIWANHKVRVADSVAYAKSQFASMASGVSAQFANMRGKISPVFNWITNIAQTAATKTKNFFGKIADPIVKASSKMKGFASDVSKAFKQRLGYEQAPITSDPSMFDALNQVQGKKLSMYDGGMTEANTAAIFDTINQKAEQGQGILQKYMTTMQGGNDALKAYIASLNGEKATMAGYNKFIQEHNAGVKSSGVAAKAAAVGHQLLNAAISMGISMLLSWVIQGVAKAINANKELAESVEEVITEYNNATKSLKDHHDTIDEIKGDYADLADGVDNLGRNVSLSTDEYERYNEIVNKIADMFPEMVSGYTEEGNAIISLKGNVDALTEAYEKEAQAARDAILIKQNDVFKNFKNNTTKEGNWSSLADNSKMHKLSFFESIIGGMSVEGWRSNNIGVTDSEIDTWLEDAGINDTNWFSGNANFDEAMRENIVSVQAYYNALKREIEAEATPIRTVLNAYLEQDFDYLKLSDEGKEIAQSIISGFDTEFYSQFDSATDMEAWITTNLVQPLQKANNLEQFELAFNLQTKFNNGEVTAKEYQNQLQKFLDILKKLGFNTDIIDTITVLFNIEDISTKVNSAKDLITGEVEDHNAENFTKEELDIIDQYKEEWKVDPATGQEITYTYEQLKEKIEAVKSSMINNDSFDILPDIENIQTSLKSLGDAFDSFKDNGIVTASTLSELKSKFGDLDGFNNFIRVLGNSSSSTQEVQKAISNLAMEYLSAKDILSDLTDENEAFVISQLKAFGVTNADEYVKNIRNIQNAMAEQYGIDLSNYGTVEQMKEAISSELYQNIVNINDDSIEDLAKQYGIDLSNFASIEAKKTAIALEQAKRRAQNDKTMAIAGAKQSAVVGKNQIEGWFGRDKLVGKTYSEVKAAYDAGEYDGKGWKDDVATWLNNVDTANNEAVKAAEEEANRIYNETIAKLEDSAGKINSLDKYAAQYNPQLSFNVDNMSGPGSDKNEDEDKRLENLRKKYEGKINNLENQKTWLENEISQEEEVGLGVSKAYYEEQIKLNDKLTGQYEAQRKELIDLRKVYPEGSEKWYEVSEAIWEMDHAIQDLTTDSIKASKAIIDLYNDAFSKIGEAYDDKLSISEDRISSMQNYAELLDLQGGTATKGLYDTMIAESQGKLDAQWEKFNALNSVVEGLKAEQNTAAPGSDEWQAFELAREQAIIEARAEQRQLKLDIQGTTEEIERQKEEFKELATQRWDDVRAAYDNRDTYYQNQIALNDKYIEKLETLGINVPDEAYEAQIESLEAASASKLEDYLQARQEMIDYEGIYGADSQEYIDKYNETIELHHEYLDYENEILAKQQEIFDNQIDRFNQVINRVNNATQRMQNISSLFENEDVATEDGEWTAEGLTRLGMAHQQMRYYEQASKEIVDKMKEVERAYKRGEISEKKYYETMQDLESQQWDMINSYEDMKDAIVDMNEARIDMIEEGIDKEIEAYQELIDLKKEELDAERDLYDFKKNIEKQTKDIAALERRIASMGGSTDASTIAERTKLQAELREAQESLDGSYRDHAYDSISTALDDELDAFTTNSENYIESLRESIKDTNQLIVDTYTQLLQNTDIVLETITTKADEYGFYIDKHLTDPWNNATERSLYFSTHAQEHISDIYDYVNTMTGPLEEGLKAPYETMTDGKDNPLYEYSDYAKKYAIDKVIEHAETNQDEMKSALEGGFNQARSSISLWSSDATTAVQNVINKFTDPQNGLLAALDETTNRAKKAKDAIDSMPNHDGGYTAPSSSGSGGSSGGSSSGGSSGGGGGGGDPKTTALQNFLNENWNGYILRATGVTQLAVDGIYGKNTRATVKEIQNGPLKPYMRDGSANGEFNSATIEAMKNFYDKQIKEMSRYPSSVADLNKRKASIPTAIFAKGTLSTKRDEWAITDESWIGEEITLAAGKNGQLQYLKKGSAVMPADISANLVEWGKLNPNMMGIGDMSGGIQLMSNYVNKPEIKLDIENFLKVGAVSKDTLPELEKLMDRKIDTFAKQLNASIRKFK